MLALIGGLDWFVKGSWAMYPLAALSIYALFVIFNRAMFFTSHVRKVDRELENVLRGTALLPERMEGELAPLLVRGIKSGELDAKRAELSVETELLQGTRFLNSLDTVANVAPMLGLLGTVWGMLITFQTIADNQGGVVPAELASGIWQALITTAVGLIVAIPALMGYRYFRSRLIRWENHLQTVVDDAQQLARFTASEVTKRPPAGGTATPAPEEV